MEIRVLGPVELIVDGEPVRVASSMRRTILAILASHPNQFVRRERLLEALWGERAADSAVARLQYHVSRLRSLLGADARIDWNDSGYRLGIAEDAVDAVRFEHLVERSAQVAPDVAASLLREALTLWRGTPFQDVDPEAVDQAEVTRLESLRMEAIERRITVELRPESAGTLITELEQLVSGHPYRESLVGWLMRAYYMAGRQADALAAYRAARERLVEDLGIEPSPMLQSLETQILNQAPELMPDSGPSAPVTRTPPEMVDDLVAAVVVDVVESTRLRTAIGDRQAEDLRRRLDRIVDHAVAVNGGEVAMRLGDGSVAVFPSATGAIHAARSMNEWLTRDNRRAGMGASVSIRTAVDIGRSSSVLAATERLCATAEPATIRLTERVCRAAGTWSEWSVGDGDPPTLRYRRRPFAELVPLPRDVSGADPLVGREAEQHALMSHLAAVADGSGRVVSISGEPGIGKSSLVSWLARTAHAGGFVVLAGLCDEAMGSPYAPVTEILDHWVTHVPEYMLIMGERIDALATISPALAAAGHVSTTTLGDAAADRARLGRALRRWLTELGSLTPVMVVVEDTQWAGAATREALEAMSGAAQETRVVLVTTSRRSPGVAAPDGDHPIVLGRLEAPALRALIRAIGPELDTGVVSELADRADGSPLFAAELARDRARGRPLNGMIPDSVRATIASRLRGVSSQARSLLQASSVLGDRFELRVVRELVDIGEPLYDAIDEAVELALLRGGGEHLTYRFAHQLIREVIYDELGDARRARLHEQAGTALERIRIGTSADLARHFSAAAPLGYGERGARYCGQAASDAIESSAIVEAEAWYRRGLKLVGDDDRLRGELLIGWGSSARQLGLEGWEEALEDAARIAERLEDGALLGRAALAGYRGTFTQALRVDEQKVGRLRRALHLVDDDALELRCRLHATLGLELEWAADPGLARAESDRALELARELGDESVMATVLTHRLWSLYHPTYERESATELLLDLTAAERRPMLALEAHGAASFTAIRRGDPELVEEHLSQAVRLATRSGVPLARWLLLLRMFPWTLARCRYVEARQMMDEMHELGRLTGHPDADQAYLTQLFWLTFDGRTRDETRQVMGASLESAHKVQRIVLPSWGHVCVEADMPAAVDRLYGMVRDEVDVERRDQLFLLRLFDMAVLAEYRSDVEMGRRLLPLIEPRADLHANMVFVTYGSMGRAMGLVCGLTGDRTSAVEWLRRAVDANRSAKLWAWLARALVDLARYDRGPARAHLDEALAIAQDRELPGVAARAASLRE